MKVRTKDGSIVRLIGWTCDHDNMFLLCEMQRRVPRSFICYSPDGSNEIRAVMLEALRVDLWEVSNLNGMNIVDDIVPSRSGS